MSAESIIARVNKIEQALKHDLAKELAKEGQRVANEHFAGMTTATLTKNGFMITGTTAMIAEFGAGATTAESHEFAPDMGFPVKRGSYSDEHHGEYQQTGYKFWHFGGHKMSRVRPRRGMYYGMRYMRVHLNEIAKRVLNK